MIGEKEDHHVNLVKPGSDVTLEDQRQIITQINVTEYNYPKINLGKINLY